MQKTKLLITFYFSFVFLLFCFLFFPPYADAHILASDKNIGALLHIDPDDTPVAGQQSGFFFDFKDKQNKFSSQDCDCTFLIVENGQTIYSQPLFQKSVFYTFPKIDVYQIKIIGKPKTPNAFQPFTLSWDWRVDQGTNQHSGIATANFFATFGVYIIVFALFPLIFLIYFLQKHFIKNKSNNN
ncbi:MAG TPA: hypothetical protein VE090_01380 [Methylomirabilota bacterium]|nr:hypothetical protein [Methylomirabilota bacterium]